MVYFSKTSGAYNKLNQNRTKMLKTLKNKNNLPFKKKKHNKSSVLQTGWEAEMLLTMIRGNFEIPYIDKDSDKAELLPE